MKHLKVFKIAPIYDDCKTAHHFGAIVASEGTCTGKEQPFFMSNCEPHLYRAGRGGE